MKKRLKFKNLILNRKSYKIKSNNKHFYII